MTTKLRIGTRGSKLALAQANIVKRELIDKADLQEEAIEIVPITTTGDKNLDSNLAEIGGKGLFIKEIEDALLESSIDIAVHSMKDMPAILHEKLIIPAILKREDVRDAYISRKYEGIADLPIGATVGTSSSRRKAILLSIRPDLKVELFRGNVNTRLNKLTAGQVDATFLAVAGLLRLGIPKEQYLPLNTVHFLPAIAQGAIGVECLKGNSEMEELLSKINHEPSYICVQAERAFLAKLEASCTTPIAALATIQGEQLTLEALIAKFDGSQIHKTTKIGHISEAEKLGAEAGSELLAKAGDNFW